MGFCVNQLGNREEAEDAVQSTFLNAHRALQRGVTPESELAWLFKIAHNVCLTRRRSKHRRGRVEAAHDLDSMQDYLPAPARESSDELIRLTDALAHMPDNQRRAILLREWQGLSYAEIARELQLSQSAVETLIFRARRSLAANLETTPDKPSLLARARAMVDLAPLVTAMQQLLSGGAAVKAAAAAVAVSGAAVVATSPPEPTHVAPKLVAPVVQTQDVARVEAPRFFAPARESADAPGQSVQVVRPAAKQSSAADAPTTVAAPSHVAEASDADDTSADAMTEAVAPETPNVVETPRSDEHASTPAHASARIAAQPKPAKRERAKDTIVPVATPARANGNGNGPPAKENKSARHDTPAVVTPVVAPASVAAELPGADTTKGKSDNAGDNGKSNGNGNGNK